MPIPHDNSEATWRVERDAERSKWSRQSGYLKRYKRSVGKTALYSGGPIRLGTVLFGSARVAVRMTPKASGQSLHDTSCINEYLTDNETLRERSHESCSFLTTTAKRRDASRATRSDPNVLDCQDRWRGINGASVELRTTKAVGFGSVRICSARLVLQCEWRLRLLANPCTTRNVLNAYTTDRATRSYFSTAKRSDQNG